MASRSVEIFGSLAIDAHFTQILRMLLSQSLKLALGGLCGGS